MTANRRGGTPNVSDEVRIIADDQALDDVVRELVGQPRYALDTEFATEGTYWPTLALVQVSWSGGIVLIDPLACDIRRFEPVLAGDGQMVAHAASGDLGILERACGRGPNRLFDTQIAAGFVGMGAPSLSWLVREQLGLQLDKANQLADWFQRPLPASVSTYAAQDVAWLLPVADQLTDALEAAGRLEWAEAEFERLLRADRRDADANTAWWKVRGGRSLRRETQGVAQAVCAWREQTARALDRPTRFVLGDLGLAAIIASPPRNAAELRRLRGIGSLRPALEQGLLAAIDEGRSLRADEIVRPSSRHYDSDLDPAVRVATAWTKQRAGELRIETALLATRSDLEDLVSGQPGRLDRGWREELVGRPVRRLVSGASMLRLVDGGHRLELVEDDATVADTNVIEAAADGRGGAGIGEVGRDGWLQPEPAGTPSGACSRPRQPVAP